MAGDERSPELVARPAAYLFGSNVARVAFKRGAYLRLFVLKFANSSATAPAMTSS